MLIWKVEVAIAPVEREFPTTLEACLASFCSKQPHWV